jgi:hypothetical protein
MTVLRGDDGPATPAKVPRQSRGLKGVDALISPRLRRGTVTARLRRGTVTARLRRGTVTARLRRGTVCNAK